MSAAGIDADRANMLQALDQAEHGGRLRRFRHLPQPGQPGLAGFLPAFDQCIKPLPLVSRKPLG